MFCPEKALRMVVLTHDTDGWILNCLVSGCCKVLRTITYLGEDAVYLAQKSRNDQLDTFACIVWATMCYQYLPLDKHFQQ